MTFFTGFLFSFRVLIRPHPAIWRLVHGIAVVYLVALTFLLFQVGYHFIFCKDLVLHIVSESLLLIFARFLDFMCLASSSNFVGLLMISFCH
jgi:hypothetical protein